MKSLAERDGAIREGSNALVRGIVDFASGAGNFHDTYSEAIEKGREDLSLAKEALGRGDTAAAERYLKDASRFIDRAELSAEKGQDRGRRDKGAEGAQGGNRRGCSGRAKIQISHLAANDD